MLISLLRLLVIVLPLAWVLSLLPNALDVIWIAFPVAELVACIVAVLLMVQAYRKIVMKISDRTNGCSED